MNKSSRMPTKTTQAKLFLSFPNQPQQPRVFQEGSGRTPDGVLDAQADWPVSLISRVEKRPERLA